MVDRNNACDEQENRPKKETTIKPDPNNSISMSNQLIKKKSSSNSRRLKRKSSSAFRNPFRKPMPSLADLEKMFEEPDDDMLLQQSTEAKQQPAPKCSAQTSSSSSPSVVIETTSPSRKRKKSFEQSDNLPPLNISSEKKSVTAENISYLSTSVSEDFCPIPSTSQSTEAFIKNENVYLESSTVNEKSETHDGTIVIEDEPIENTFAGVKIKVHDPQIIDITKGFTPTTQIERQNSYDDDDDCIIVENTNNNTINQPNIFDIVLINTIRENDGHSTEHVHHSTEHVHHSTEHVGDEIIDVDAIIAHNQSLICKHKTKSGPSNHVVDVDISTPTQSANIPNGHTSYDHQPELKASDEKTTISLNVQSQPSDDLVHRHRLEPTQPATHRTFPTSFSSENYLHLLTQNGAPAATKSQYVGTTAIIKPHNNRSFKKGSSTDAYAGKGRSKSTHSLGDCPICIENMTGKEIGTTTCGHVFCMRCLKISMKRTKRCPTCRTVLRRNGFHKIFI